MGLFSKNPLEEQVDVYTELLKEKEEQFSELEDVDTGAAKLEREALRDDIANIKINIEQTRDQITDGQSLNDMSD